MKENLSKLAELLRKIKDCVKNSSVNLLWTHYETKNEIINELDNHIKTLNEGKISEINELIILFSPTSDLQELSINNGWGNLFLDYAKKFDRIINNI